MAKGTKGGSVFVEIYLDKDQFDKDFKAAQREVVAVQKQLSLEMQRNKVKFEVEGLDKNWADKLFGNTVIGKIKQAKQETAFLNQQMAFQQNKVDVASAAWKSLVTSKGAMSGAALNAERAFMREQVALVGLKKQMDSTTTASDVMSGAMKTSAIAAAAAVAALATAYATAIKASVAWGQAVNDIADETGMADAEAAKLLGTMNVLGISVEEASGILAKLAKNVTAASIAQDAAAKTGKTAEDAFTKYGIAIRDAEGNLLDYPQIMANVTEVHRDMQDGLQKTALEMEIFGKSGYKLNDLLNLTSKRADEIALKMEKLGLATGVNSQKSENFNQQLNEMKLAFTSIANTITGDDIPAIEALIKRFTDLAIWIKENKNAITEISRGAFTGFEIAMWPVTKSFELAAAAIQKYVEWREKAIGMARVNLPAGETDAAGWAAQDKAIEASAAKQEAARKAVADAKRKTDMEMLKSSFELNNAILALERATLQVTLNNIDEEEKAWLKKTNSEVKASQWAEAARLKAHTDAQTQINAAQQKYQDSLKSIQSASAGIGGAFQGAFGSAIKQVADNLKKGNSSGVSDAVRAMREEYELQKQASRIVASEVGLSGADSGLYDPVSAQQQMQKAFEALNEATKAADQSKIDYLKTIAANTARGFTPENTTTTPQPTDPRLNATGGDKVIPGQNLTITVNSSVNVNGMDQQSAQQLGEVAAQQIIPQVQQAVARAQTQYGGEK